MSRTLAMLVLWVLAGTVQAAQQVVIPDDLASVDPGITELVSPAEQMISFRQQEHFWLTQDGARHLLVNLGPRGLVLYSRAPAGGPWVQQLVLPGTDERSNADGRLSDDTLDLAYSTSRGGVAYAQLHYTAADGSWQVALLEPVFSTLLYKVYVPSLTVDSLGRRWAAFPVTNRLSGITRLRVYHRDAGRWHDTGARLGTRNTGRSKGAKLVAMPDRIAVFYSDVVEEPDGAVTTSRRWAWRQLQGPLQAPWRDELLMELSQPVSIDPVGTHFEVSVEPQGRAYFLTTDDHRLMLMRFDPASGSWDEPFPLIDDYQVAYMEAARTLDGRLIVVANVGRYVAVLESADGGETFTWRYLLLVPESPALDYSNPRIEIPVSVNSSLPVLRQLELLDQPLFTLVDYEVPL